MQAFVEYIKERKTVVLEDLAAEFGMRVQVCADTLSMRKLGGAHCIGCSCLVWPWH